MTLSNDPAKEIKNGNDATTVFPFTFVINKSDDLVVTLTDSLGVETVVTEGTGTDNYSISVVSYPGNGSITYPATLGTELETGKKLTLSRLVDLDQETDLQNQSKYKPETVESALDYSRMVDLQQQEQLDRSVKVAISDSSGANITLPTPSPNKVIGVWNDDATEIVEGPTASEISGANASAIAAAADAVQTAADRVQTGLDVISTNADVVSTAADRVQTGLDATATAADVVSTNADAVQTALDRIATGDDATATAADVVSTNADVVSTNADVVSTAADRVQTGLDRTSSGNSETNAAASAAAAAASAAEGLYNDVITLTNSDSPYVPSQAQEGTAFRLDMSGGSIVINLSALSVYGEDMKFAFVKVDAGGNSATINRGGTDTISGLTSISLSTQYETHVVVGDEGTGTWIDTVQSTGLSDNQVTNPKLADMSEATVKGRASGSGSGDPVDLTETQLRTIIGNASETLVGLVEKSTTAEMNAGTADKFPDAAKVKAYVDSETAGITSGSLVKLAEVVISNDSAVEFDSTIFDGTYDKYIVEFLDVRPSSDGQTLRFQVSDDDGATRETSLYQTHIINYRNTTGQGTHNSGTITYGKVHDAAIGTSGTGEGGLSGHMEIIKPHDTDNLYKLWPIRTSATMTDGNLEFCTGHVFLAGVIDSANINNIEFYAGSGNLNTGIIKVYGVV